jgi:hypothetical protein
LGIKDNSVSLVITSPPFLDTVDYAMNNWLRHWFIGLNAENIDFSVQRQLVEWEELMIRILQEVYCALCPNGWLVFEVGEIRGGKICLEHSALRCGVFAGFRPVLVMINQQLFTKTAQCWGVDNNQKGTNSNRIVVFRRD